jgi:hypothetical protein
LRSLRVPTYSRRTPRRETTGWRLFGLRDGARVMGRCCPGMRKGWCLATCLLVDARDGVHAHDCGRRPNGREPRNCKGGKGRSRTTIVGGHQRGHHARFRPRGLLPAATHGYDDGMLDLLADRLADLLADRLADRLSAPPLSREALIDAREIARLTGRTRAWVYSHAGELGAVRLGSGPRPRLGFVPERVLAVLDSHGNPSRSLPAPAPSRPRRRQRHGLTEAGAELLRVRVR